MNKKVFLFALLAAVFLVVIPLSAAEKGALGEGLSEGWSGATAALRNLPDFYEENSAWIDLGLLILFFVGLSSSVFGINQQFASRSGKLMGVVFGVILGLAGWGWLHLRLDRNLASFGLIAVIIMFLTLGIGIYMALKRLSGGKKISLPSIGLLGAAIAFVVIFLALEQIFPGTSESIKEINYLGQVLWIIFIIAVFYLIYKAAKFFGFTPGMPSSLKGIRTGKIPKPGIKMPSVSFGGIGGVGNLLGPIKGGKNALRNIVKRMKALNKVEMKDLRRVFDKAKRSENDLKKIKAQVNYTVSNLQQGNVKINYKNFVGLMKDVNRATADVFAGIKLFWNLQRVELRNTGLEMQQMLLEANKLRNVALSLNNSKTINARMYNSILIAYNEIRSTIPRIQKEITGLSKEVVIIQTILRSEQKAAAQIQLLRAKIERGGEAVRKNDAARAISEFNAAIGLINELIELSYRIGRNSEILNKFERVQMKMYRLRERFAKRLEGEIKNATKGIQPIVQLRK